MKAAAVEIPNKSIEDSFKDWESSAFGFGYGSGEPYVIPALRTFLEHCTGLGGTAYDYAEMERLLGPVATWLLISALCRADILEYGTSPRFGWLTPHGKRLQDFMLSKSADGLVEIACAEREGYDVCYPDVCNHGPDGYVAGRVCSNPFWPNKRGSIR